MARQSSSAASEIVLSLEEQGAEHHRAMLSAGELDGLLTLADRMPANRAGIRLFGDQSLLETLGKRGRIGQWASEILGENARPVRAVLFDKTMSTNWLVPWHQDRTVALRERFDVDGFGPWSIKGGVHHVEPPFELLSGMVTVRAHLDDCDDDNAPLLIAPGSHRLGRVKAGEAQKIAESIGQVACHAEARDVWVYSTPILHASNRSARPRRRRVLQVDYSKDDLPAGLDWIGIA